MKVYALIITMAVIMVSGISYAESQTTYFTDFSNGQIPNWVHTENSTIENGKLVQHSSRYDNINMTWVEVDRNRSEYGWVVDVHIEPDHSYTHIYNIGKESEVTANLIYVFIVGNQSITLDIQPADLSSSYNYTIYVWAKKLDDPTGNSILLSKNDTYDYPYFVDFKVKFNRTSGIFQSTMNCDLHHGRELYSTYTGVMIDNDSVIVGAYTENSQYYNSEIHYPDYTYNITQISINYITSNSDSENGNSNNTGNSPQPPTIPTHVVANNVWVIGGIIIVVVAIVGYVLYRRGVIQ